MTDKRWAAMTGTKQINRTAQRRQHAAERAAAIAKLGMAPEGERYAASTGELVKWSPATTQVEELRDVHRSAVKAFLALETDDDQVFDDAWLATETAWQALERAKSELAGIAPALKAKSCRECGRRRPAELVASGLCVDCQ